MYDSVYESDASQSNIKTLVPKLEKKENNTNRPIFKPSPKVRVDRKASFNKQKEIGSPLNSTQFSFQE